MSKFFFFPIAFACCFMVLATEAFCQKYEDGVYHLEKFYETQNYVPPNFKELDWIPYKKDDLYGFVEKGNPDNWLIEPMFEQVAAVYKDAAIVKHKGYWWLTGKERKMIISRPFDHIEKVGNIYHGISFHAREKGGDEYSSSMLNVYYNLEGKELFRAYAKQQKSFTNVDTLACFKKGKEVSIRGISGKLWKKFTVEKEGVARKEFVGIENNLLLYRENLDTTFIYTGVDIHGKEVFNINYNRYAERIVQINPYLFMYERDYGYQFFNEKGQAKDFQFYPKTFQGKRYHDMFYLAYYYLFKKSTQKMGLINRAGKQLLDFEYDYIDDVFEDNVFCVEQISMNGTFGFGQIYGSGKILSTKGKVVVDSIWLGYDLVERFKGLGLPVAFYEGLLFNVKTGDFHYDSFGDMEMLKNTVNDLKLHFYYYDKKGKTQIELTPDVLYAGRFHEGLAMVVNSNAELGFINRKGEMAIDFKYEISKNPSYALPYYSIPEFKDGFAYVQPYDAYIDKDGMEYFSYTDKYDLPNGPTSRWMEIRREKTDNLIGDRFICLDFTMSNNGTIKVGHHDDPTTKYVNGIFEIKDSLLLLNPQDEDGSRLRYLVDDDEFLIEKMDKDSLILRTTSTVRGAQNTRFYFVPKSNFDQYTRAEILNQFAFPQKDSLLLDALIKKQNAERELRKKDRHAPEFPDGFEAMEQYVKDNMVYPEGHSEVRVIRVSFSVNEKGEIFNIHTNSGPSDAYNIEAIRVVESMPKWLPATTLGKPRDDVSSLNVLFEARKE